MPSLELATANFMHFSIDAAIYSLTTSHTIGHLPVCRFSQSLYRYSDGAGIYRHVWLSFVSTPGPYVAPWGVYAPSRVTGTIDWSSGAPMADAVLTPSVEVWNNATSSQAFSVALSVLDAAGKVVATATGAGSVPGVGGVTTWTPTSPITLTGAALWHTLPKPALYKLATTLTVGGIAVDAITVTFGVRSAVFDAATGFILNGKNVKIMGSSNHQDFSAVVSGAVQQRSALEARCFVFGLISIAIFRASFNSRCTLCNTGRCGARPHSVAPRGKAAGGAVQWMANCT